MLDLKHEYYSLLWNRIVDLLNIYMFLTLFSSVVVVYNYCPSFFDSCYHDVVHKWRQKHVDCCFLFCMSCLHFMLTDQTLTNIQPHLVNIAQHAGQIAAQSAGTLATNLGKTVLNALGAGATTATTAP